MTSFSNHLSKRLVESSIMILSVLVVSSVLILVIGEFYKIQFLVDGGKLLLVSMGIGSFTSLATGYAIKISDILDEELNEGRTYKVQEILLEFTITPVRDENKEWWEVTLKEIRKGIKLTSNHYNRDFFEIDIPHGDIDQCSFEKILIRGKNGHELTFHEGDSTVSTKRITETYKTIHISFAPFTGKNSVDKIEIYRRIPYTAHAWPNINTENGKYYVVHLDEDKRFFIGRFGYTLRVPTTRIVLRIRIPKEFILTSVNVLDWYNNLIYHPEGNIFHEDDKSVEFRYELLPGYKRFYIDTKISFEILRPVPDYISTEDVETRINNNERVRDTSPLPSG